MSKLQPAKDFQEIISLPDSEILANRAQVKGQVVYLGDMASIPVRLKEHKHTCQPRKMFNQGYTFLDGSPYYFWDFDCTCCHSGHNFLLAISNYRLYLGRVCSRCGFADDREPLAAQPEAMSSGYGDRTSDLESSRTDNADLRIRLT